MHNIPYIMDETFRQQVRDIQCADIDLELIKDVILQIDINLQNDPPELFKKDMINYFNYISTGSFRGNPFHIRLMTNMLREDDYSIFKFVSKLAKHYSISKTEENSILVWMIRQMMELKTKLKLDRDAALFKVLRTVFGALSFMVNKVSKKKVKSNFSTFIKRAFYFGMGYVIDDIIDGPYSDTLKTCIDKILESIIGSDSILIDIPDLPPDELVIAQIVKSYLIRFSNMIRGIKTEEELRYELIMFHRCQRANHNSATGNEQLYSYSDIIGKSFYCRYLIPLVFGIKPSNKFKRRMLVTALNFQLYDDLQDFTEDRANGSRTPFTHNNKYENPFTMMLMSLTLMLRDRSAPSRRAIIFRFLQIIRTAEAQQTIEDLKNIIPTEIKNIFDMCIGIRDSPQSVLQYEQIYRNRVLSTMSAYSSAIKTHQDDMTRKINEWIGNDSDLSKYILYAANGGKCTRSLLTRLMGMHYGIDCKTIDHFMISIELSQSASLLFDDLPAQDDAHIRRGVDCLHIIYPEYVAQMTGLSMVMESYRALTYMPIDDVTKNKIIRMSTELAGKDGLCKGQLIDLEESPKTIEEFKEMYWLKTGIAFYVSLAGVAIIANKEDDLHIIRNIAYNLGVAYQIRDDLLEVAADQNKMASRTALRIVDVDYNESLREFYKARTAVFDRFIELGMSHAISHFLGLICKVLRLDSDTDEIYELGNLS
jgi:geranylgeranyl pyrophosphate synthase